MTWCDKQYPKEADERQKIIDQLYMEIVEMITIMEIVEIITMIIDHAMDRITFCRQKCNLVCFLSHIFKYIWKEVVVSLGCVLEADLNKL